MILTIPGDSLSVLSQVPTRGDGSMGPAAGGSTKSSARVPWSVAIECLLAVVELAGEIARPAAAVLEHVEGRHDQQALAQVALQVALLEAEIEAGEEGVPLAGAQAVGVDHARRHLAPVDGRGRAGAEGLHPQPAVVLAHREPDDAARGGVGVRPDAGERPQVEVPRGQRLARLQPVRLSHVAGGGHGFVLLSGKAESGFSPAAAAAARSPSRTRGRTSRPKKAISSLSGQPMKRNCVTPIRRYSRMAAATSAAEPTSAMAGAPR